MDLVWYNSERFQTLDEIKASSLFEKHEKCMMKIFFENSNQYD